MENKESKCSFALALVRFIELRNMHIIEVTACKLTYYAVMTVTTLNRDRVWKTNKAMSP